ncbi:hypothetical protein [Streptomyces sp. NPDC093225]|uniref:hypothetical protein n=1 Tax=Streptomyces sp. NPDC093225 TaxID=3366034 RepID=UPI00380B2BC6
MSFPSGIRSGEPSTGQAKVRQSLPPRPMAGSYAVDEALLLENALDAVRARPDIANQLRLLQNAPDLAAVVEEQQDLLQRNLNDQLERTRQVAGRLDDLLVTQMRSDPVKYAAFTELSEVADELRDSRAALLDLNRGLPRDAAIEAMADYVRDQLTVAWQRREKARRLLVARTSGTGNLIRGIAKESPAAPPTWPNDSRVAIFRELTALRSAQAEIEAGLVEDVREQQARASERQDYRALETEWRAARAELDSVAESCVYTVVVTALNSAVAAQFALSMKVGSLDLLRETVANRKVVMTSAFERLESMIDRWGEGSFGIAGPRGVGKSRLIEYFTTSSQPTTGAEEADLPPKQTRVGVRLAAPVAYDPRDFVLHLHAEVCRALLGPDADRSLEAEVNDSPRPRYATRAATAVGIALGGVAVLATGATLVARAARLVTAPDDAWTYAGLALTTAAVALMVVLFAAAVELAVPPAFRSTSTSAPASEGGPASEQDRRHARVEGLTRRWCPALALCAAGGLSLLTVSGGLGRGTWMLLGGVAMVLLGAALILAGSRLATSSTHFWRIARAGTPDKSRYSREAALRELALDQLRQIRYEQTLSSEHTMTLRLGGARQLPVGVDIGAKRGTTVAERAKSYPEIVAGLRVFLEAVTQHYQLIIAVDELDKLRSADEVEKFLNDVKGMFGASRCFFLVSVSEEAAAGFARRGMPFRDVFDSCFDDVLALQRLELSTAQQMLHGLLLGWKDPFVALCYVLSGGLPRELQRSARALVGQHEEGSEIDLVQAVPQLMRSEAVARLAGVRHGLLREAAGPAGLALVNRIEVIEPEGASADRFREWYEELGAWCLRQYTVLRPTDGSPQMPAATRLGCELAAYMLFAATVMQFFGAHLTSERLKQATAPGAGAASLTKLADARHALSLSPWTAVGCLISFRDAWGL